MKTAKRDTQELTLLVSRATHQLSSSSGGLAAALLDVGSTPRMLFSNSALSQVNGMAIVMLARDYLQQANGERLRSFVHELEDERRLYLTVLDDKHVVAVVGKAQDEAQIQAFNDQLKTLLS